MIEFIRSPIFHSEPKSPVINLPSTSAPIPSCLLINQSTNLCAIIHTIFFQNHTYPNFNHRREIRLSTTILPPHINPPDNYGSASRTPSTSSTIAYPKSSSSSSPHSSSSNIYPPYAHALAGAGGGLATVLTLHPLDTLRTRLQSTHRSTLSRPGDALRLFYRIATYEGIHALYKGVVPAALGSVMSWACYFHWFQRTKNIISFHVPYDTAAHLLSGTIAGLLTSLATNPIWVVKVRLQLQSLVEQQRGNGSHTTAMKRPYNGFLDGLVSIAREEGMRGLYKGIGPSIILVSHGALQFTLYEKFKSWLQSNPELLHENEDSTTSGTSVSHSLLASTASKLVASISTYPMQVSRTRMQERFADGNRYGRFDKAFMYILRTEGIQGLYRGLSANIARVTPQAAVTFITYEQVLKMCAQKQRQKTITNGEKKS